MKIVILLSGGLDSTVMLHEAIKEKHECFALTFDYGQTQRMEIAFARTLATRYHVPQQIVNLDSEFLRKHCESQLLKESAKPAPLFPNEIPMEASQFVVPGRNLLFLAYAYIYAQHLKADEIYLGANAADYNDFPDCRRSFIHCIEDSFIAMAHGPKIVTPLYNYSKQEIVRRALLYNIEPNVDVLSCYQPLIGGLPCGICPTCKLITKALEKLATEGD